MHSLQMFTSSLIMRQECHIEFDVDSPKDINIMAPIFHILADLTTFQVVSVEMTGVGGAIPRWYSPDYAQARWLWNQMSQDLRFALGSAIFARGPSFRYLEFKPRQHLMRKGLCP